MLAAWRNLTASDFLAQKIEGMFTVYGAMLYQQSYEASHWEPGRIFWVLNFHERIDNMRVYDFINHFTCTVERNK